MEKNEYNRDVLGLCIICIMNVYSREVIMWKQPLYYYYYYL